MAIIDKHRGRLRTLRMNLPHNDAPLTLTTLDALQDGDVAVGYSGATIQMGFVVNGTAVIFSALAGTGAVTASIAT